MPERSDKPPWRTKRRRLAARAARRHWAPDLRGPARSLSPRPAFGHPPSLPLRENRGGGFPGAPQPGVSARPTCIFQFRGVYLLRYSVLSMNAGRQPRRTPRPRFSGALLFSPRRSASGRRSTSSSPLRWKSRAARSNSPYENHDFVVNWTRRFSAAPLLLSQPTIIVSRLTRKQRFTAAARGAFPILSDHSASRPQLIEMLHRRNSQAVVGGQASNPWSVANSRLNSVRILRNHPLISDCHPAIPWPSYKSSTSSAFLNSFFENQIIENKEVNVYSTVFNTNYRPPSVLDFAVENFDFGLVLNSISRPLGGVVSFQSGPPTSIHSKTPAQNPLVLRFLSQPASFSLQFSAR